MYLFCSRLKGGLSLSHPGLSEMSFSSNEGGCGSESLGKAFSSRGAGVAGWWGAFVPIHIKKGLSAVKNGGGAAARRAGGAEGVCDGPAGAGSGWGMVVG